MPSLIQWLASEHPRDPFGRFLAVTRGLSVGQKAEIKTTDSQPSIFVSAVANGGKREFHVTHGKDVTRHAQSAAATRHALSLSAAQAAPVALGGTDKYDDLAHYQDVNGPGSDPAAKTRMAAKGLRPRTEKVAGEGAPKRKRGRRGVVAKHEAPRSEAGNLRALHVGGHRQLHGHLIVKAAKGADGDVYKVTNPQGDVKYHKGEGKALAAIKPGSGAGTEERKVRQEFGLPSVGPKLGKFKLSEFLWAEASGSDIMAEHGGGYDKLIGAELRRLGSKGGTMHLTKNAMLDLAEFFDAMELAIGQGGNPAGARSAGNAAAKLRQLAKGM
jgi:hypothetical protein